jgi:NTP pyrophosphatase (non-canonical NTP hydrolase)
MNKTILNNYKTFVDGVTSNVSKDPDLMQARLVELLAKGADMPRLLTAGIGLSSETGEFNEIVKKVTFHGKDYDEANIFHMKRELGDIIWYWMQACLALNLEPNEVIEENVKKLEARYPGGVFSVWHSENRADGDI